MNDKEEYRRVVDLLDQLGFQGFSDDAWTTAMIDKSRGVTLSLDPEKPGELALECRVATFGEFLPERWVAAVVAMLAANKAIRPIAFSLDPSVGPQWANVPILLTTSLPFAFGSLSGGQLREVLDSFKRALATADAIIAEHRLPRQELVPA